MKRMKVSCGICKGTKYYAIQRGITKVSSIIACENCKHFYQKLKRHPFNLDCISPIKGSCYKDCSFMKTRCKGCWAMQLLDSCPHPESFYTELSKWISEDCRKLIRGLPLLPEEIGDGDHGDVAIEVYEDDEWKPSSSPDEDLELLPVINEDQVIEPATAGQEEEEQQRKKKEKSRDVLKNRNMARKEKEDLTSTLSVGELTLDAEPEVMDVEDEEAMIDDPEPVTNVMPSTKISQRVKRRRRKVEYFVKPVTGRKTKGAIYGSDGKINKTGMDLCDCLQAECVGCHFPCPKCRSPKCGNECRVNRRWYYEKVEVEGTKMFYVNRFVPKI